MGERVQKIAFLVFALMFVAIMAVLNTSILTLGTSANSQLASTVSGTDSSMAIYDQSTVYGSSVQSCAKDPGNVCSTDMQIFVVTKADLAGEEYTSAANDQYTGSVDEAKRINSAAKFDSYLCYNANNVCTGILFIQDGAVPSDLSTLCGTLTVQGYTPA